MRDLHDRYLRGVGDLLQIIEPTEDDYLTVLTHQGRLAEVISEIRRYGLTDNARAEIAKVTTELDRICLRRLHQSFRSLCGIPEVPPAEPEILHNLPPRPFFVGRQREIRLLQEYLSPDWRVALVSIDGIGGIGKTTLAREIAHRLVEECAFEAVVWATAQRRILLASGIADRQPDFTSLDELLDIVARALRTPPSENKSAAVRQSLAEFPSLIVVDNFETVKDRRVFEFLRQMPGKSKALVTNRYRPAAQIRGGELVLPLVGMAKDDAFILLRNTGRTIPRPLSDADDSLLEKIFERTHGSPLAMEWFAFQVERGRPILRVLEHLRQPKANDLYAFIFEDSYSTLSTNARKALWAMAAIHSPTVEDQIRYVAELSPGEFERAADELTGTSLAIFDYRASRWSIHSMTHEYAAALMDQELERWTRRAIEWESKVRFEGLDETAKAAIRLLSATDKPIPIPTLVKRLGDISANALNKLIASLQETGLALHDEALQMVTLEPRVREFWQAQLAGNGALAQGDAVAGGKYSIAISGDVQGTVIGDHVQVTVTHSARVDEYLRYLNESQGRIPLAVLAPRIVEPRSALHLSDLYVPLHSTQLKSAPSVLPEGDHESLSMLEAVVHDRRVLILGDPGSGKTTFLRYLAGAAARQRLGETEELPAEIAGVPLLVKAIDYSMVSLGETHLPFVELLVRHLASLGFSDLIDYLKWKLAAGECMILVDGLDELAGERQRRQIVTQIEDFVIQYPNNRIIITSRIASLQEPSLFSAEWARHVIAPFGEEQIDRFVAAWYRWLTETGTIDAATADRKARGLSYALRQGRHLGEFAANPLLLTVIVTLHFHSGKLPEDRITLYSEICDVLFARWEWSKAPEMSLLERLDIPGLRASDLQGALEEVAFRVQADRNALLSETTLSGIIFPYLSSDWSMTARFVEYIRERAGLLVERAVGQYSFVHLALQEFYAARHLASREEYPQIAIELLRADFDLWREVYLLSVLYLDQIGQTARAIGAMQALCPQEHRRSEINLRLITVAGQAITEIGLLRVERTEPGKELVNSVRTTLIQLLESGMLSARERAFAGDVLADIGDPRFTFTLAGDMLVPDIAWCEVPVGPFLMGSSREKDHDASDDEQPQHRVELPAYHAGRYPVINAQYRYFIESGGYSERQYWTEQGWAWRQDQGIDSPQFWDDPTWNGSNHPVVGVSWYEAVAFSCWLTMHLREAGLLPEQMVMRLPTEAEWEKAARGSDGRIRPWGDEWDPERANTGESDCGQTTAVGVYPAGASPYGCLEMSGNVWEWTLSLWGRADSRTDFPYPYRPDDGREDVAAEGKRIIRGGSWASPRIHARVGFRGMADPCTRNPMIGFRVALCSVIPEL